MNAYWSPLPDVAESRSTTGDDYPPVVTLRKRFRLFATVLAVVVGLSLLKTAIHWVGLEFLTLNALFTSAIAAAVFIIGFLLSSVLADYKEAERIPTDMRVALEAVHDDSRSFARNSGFNADTVALTLLAIGECQGSCRLYYVMIPPIDEAAVLAAQMRTSDW
jgi:hypothetical protein